MEYRIEQVVMGKYANYYPQYKYTDWRRIFGWRYCRDWYGLPEYYWSEESARMHIQRDIGQRNPKITYLNL